MNKEIKEMAQVICKECIRLNADKNSCDNDRLYHCDSYWFAEQFYNAGYRNEKDVVKDFAEKLKQAICDNTYPDFDKDGKPVIIWNTDGFDKIDELLKEYCDE